MPKRSMKSASAKVGGRRVQHRLQRNARSRVAAKGEAEGERSEAVSANSDTNSKVCKRCGHVNVTEAERCANARCRSVLARNQIAWKFPTLDEASPELRAAAAQTVAGIISDKGGIDSMSTLERSLAQEVGDLSIMLELLKARIVRCGLITSAGKVSPSYDKYIVGLGMKHKYASALGLKREAKDVNDVSGLSFEEYALVMAAREERERAENDQEPITQADTSAGQHDSGENGGIDPTTERERRDEQ